MRYFLKTKANYHVIHVPSWGADNLNFLHVALGDNASFFIELIRFLADDEELRFLGIGFYPIDNISMSDLEANFRMISASIEMTVQEQCCLPGLRGLLQHHVI